MADHGAYGGGGGGSGSGRPQRAAAKQAQQNWQASEAAGARIDRHIEKYRPPYYNKDGSVNKYYLREGYGK